MRRTIVCCGALALCALGFAADPPSITGVWKADLDQSKFMGRQKPTAYLTIIQKQGNTVRISSALTSMMGEYRAAFTFGTGTQESKNTWHGLPMISKAQWEDGTLVVDSRVPGTEEQKIHDKYSLSADGNTLTIETSVTRGEHDMPQTVVLTRQPDEAGEPLRQPEITAGKRFKNVTVLGDMPSSRFLDAMGTFGMSLGKHCEFCHVEMNFASDDKKEKTVARDMIKMTHGLNEANFNGRPEVRCYTCHRGAEHPQGSPQ